MLPAEEERDGPVLVVGLAATNVSWQMGGWTIGWQGSAGGPVLPPRVTIMQGVREALGSSKVLTARLDEPRQMFARRRRRRAPSSSPSAREPYAEWYGDNPSGALAPDQVQLVKAAEATGKPVVLVDDRRAAADDHRSRSRRRMLSSCASLPGTEAGHGVADVLFGRVAAARQAARQLAGLDQGRPDGEGSAPRRRRVGSSLSSPTERV